MNKPIIIAIDDEPQVLNAVARDLQARYQNEYQIMTVRDSSTTVVDRTSRPAHCADRRSPSHKPSKSFGRKRGAVRRPPRNMR